MKTRKQALKWTKEEPDFSSGLIAATNLKPNHKHKWKYVSRGGCDQHLKPTKHKSPRAYVKYFGQKEYICSPLNFEFRCECKEIKTRIATEKERQKVFTERREHERRSKEMHSIWHDFQKRFKEKSGWGEWKYNGYSEPQAELVDKIYKWADKQDPEKVQVLRCDDSMHMGSDLILIHHMWTDLKTKRKYNWGTSVVLFTQDGQPPAEFFLYPGHAKGIIDALSKVYKMREPNKLVRLMRKLKKKKKT